MGQTFPGPVDLNDILVFAKVVQTGSFIGASRSLGMPKSTVSRKVAELEERLGARLLQRTTRKLGLTDVGRAFHHHALRVLSAVEEAEQVVTKMQETPRGLLRVTTPLNFGFLAPTLTAFMRRYPEVRLEVVGGERVVDLVQEGFDVAIRAGELEDSSLVARSLGTLESYLVASPGFLRRQGAPTKPEDLARIDCVVFAGGSEGTRWRLTRAARTVTVDVNARFVVNDFEFLDEAARSGLGIAMVPIFRCIDDLRTKRLCRVLPEWCARKSPLHAVYPTTRHLSPKVKAFLEHLSQAMTPPPWERGPRSGPSGEAHR
jgi:DNA-binding transcriptional LysR family regulator